MAALPACDFIAGTAGTGIVVRGAGAAVSALGGATVRDTTGAKGTGSGVNGAEATRCSFAATAGGGADAICVTIVAGADGVVREGAAGGGVAIGGVTVAGECVTGATEAVTCEDVAGRAGAFGMTVAAGAEVDGVAVVRKGAAGGTLAATAAGADEAAATEAAACKDAAGCAPASGVTTAADVERVVVAAVRNGTAGSGVWAGGATAAGAGASTGLVCKVTAGSVRTRGATIAAGAGVVGIATAVDRKGATSGGDAVDDVIRSTVVVTAGVAFDRTVGTAATLVDEDVSTVCTAGARFDVLADALEAMAICAGAGRNGGAGVLTAIFAEVAGAEVAAADAVATGVAFGATIGVAGTVPEECVTSARTRGKGSGVSADALKTGAAWAGAGRNGAAGLLAVTIAGFAGVAGAAFAAGGAVCASAVRFA